MQSHTGRFQSLLLDRHRPFVRSHADTSDSRTQVRYSKLASKLRLVDPKEERKPCAQTSPREAHVTSATSRLPSTASTTPPRKQCPAVTTQHEPDRYKNSLKLLPCSLVQSVTEGVLTGSPTSATRGSEKALPSLKLLPFVRQPLAVTIN